MPPKQRKTNNSSQSDVLRAAILAQDQEAIEKSNSYVLRVVGTGMGDFVDHNNNNEEDESEEEGQSQASGQSEASGVKKKDSY